MPLGSTRLVLPRRFASLTQGRLFDSHDHSTIAFSYSKVHTIRMASVRRTISLPPGLADRLDGEAERRGVTFSALIADLAGSELTELPYAGIIADDVDLSLRVEEVLSRLAS